MKPMRLNHDDPYLANDYPHFLIVIEKAEKLLEMKDQRAVDWLESLVIRLYNDERFRRHFPVVLETTNTLYFNFEIFDKLNLESMLLLNLNFDGYGANSKIASLSKIYNTDQLAALHKIVGNSIYHTHLFTEMALRSNIKFSELVFRLDKDLPEFIKIKRIFYNRLNKVL